MKLILAFALLLITSVGFTQNSDLPTDFLSKGFHKERREKRRESMPTNSVSVFFANAVRNRANDVDYTYHQDPDFFYLTGYKEPDAVLFVLKTNRPLPTEFNTMKFFSSNPGTNCAKCGQADDWAKLGQKRFWDLSRPSTTVNSNV